MESRNLNKEIVVGFQAEIIEACPVALVAIAPNGKIVLVNAETEKLFGYQRAELLDQSVEILLPERFRPEHPGHRTGFFANPEARRMGAGRDLFGLRKDGREFPVEIGLNPVETEEGLFVLSAIADITERKKLEQRFQATVESAPTAMVMIDGQGQIVLVNAETEKLFGYQRAELLDQSVEILLPERFRPEHPDHRSGFFANPDARRMGAGRDLFGLRKDGREFPVEIGLNPVETDEGLFVLSAIADITERKKLEQRFQATVESAPTAMVMIDGQGQIVLVNAETEKLFGYQRAELIDQSVEILLPERFRPEHPDHRSGFFANPDARRMGEGRDLFGLRKDGREFPVEIGLNPVETDEGLFVLSAIADITERKRLEQRFQATVESAPMAMVMIDGQGKIVLVNTETEKLFGYQRTELIDQTVEILLPERFRSDHPNHRTGFFANPDARRMGEGRDLFGLHKDGREFPVEIGLNPVETDEGLFVLSAIADITERKRLENNLISINEELDRSNKELEQFAYIASHDLQEPLRKVASCCQMLEEDYADKLDDDGREWIHFAVDGATRMRQLVTDLLEFSRVGTRGKAATPIDAHQACQEAINNLADAIEEHDAQIICHPLPVILADELQLVQLFQNLIGNSLKYCKETQPVIEIGAEPNDHQWKFYVKDNGIGIAPEFHERIFQIFQRLHRKEEYSGTGIGLAICKKVLERLGGRLWVESQSGEGSTFYFTLTAANSINESTNKHVINNANLADTSHGDPVG